ncbi:TPA_asm: M15 family peptidase [Listeria monocytogenes]|uniref:M15 family metallopeptidase n=2 Tax=Listeria monocytogenes TaxID=1639 RepID=UPI0001C2F3C8|nr:M15 family metallopeptidase [Listeria monocytogenes]ADB68120.1 L-alanoyl-D-glutamate peptidase [Listeria monocytogenes 08-5578]ADB71165.1 L-alanoyl-D-glutamate peptidase [Listeria monocytogenes 08-5923]AHF32040.1 L-alanoyl-D-glutamate peptidase [Listeria monocytogenes serotype 1/2a str. 08-6569]AHF35031.1 L-alanoyl-D-glutamate peptidase [Listeria monocytogenes serotype 1/2a str. 08-6997]AHF38022.1 L-alanoyl-D-glutamate peptidase [Listeria monocytogenes serotype 1/2a str. 10-0815]
MTSYYYSRSLANVNKLADNTKAAARKLLDWAENSGIEVLIYETIRTKEQQSANVANGASQTMRSYHLVGQALDFVMAKGKTVDWGAYRSDKGKKFVAKAKSLGFEWGGDWSGFVDNPHLQFNYKGYGTDTFGKGASTSNSSKPSANTNSLGLVDYMVSKKMDSSFSNRAKLAAKYGIKGYKGTASQNTTLLAKLKAGKPHTPASSNKNTYYTENPKKIKTLVQCDLYNSVDFTASHKTGGTYPPGTIFTIAGMAKTKGGTPRLKTKSGYFLTANKKFVKKI